MTKPRILLVEDERIIAFDLQQQLTGLGYEVVALASRGEQAVEQAVQHTPDVVLMDIQLEGRMDGIEAARIIHRHLGTPVVFLSAFAEQETVKRAQQSLPYGYLVKPCHTRELHASLQIALARRAAEVAVERSEKRLQLALEAAQLTVFEWEPVGGKVSVGARGSGGHASNVETEDFNRFVARALPEDRDGLARVLRQALAQEEPIELDFRYTQPNNVTGWMRLVAQAHPVAPNGAPLVTGVLRDVSASRRADELLFAEKERAQVTLDCIGDAVITTDAKGVIEYLNPVAETLTGWSCAQARGRALEEVFRIVNEETREVAPNPVARCLADGRVQALANHTVLLGRGGAECAIEDSAAPIRGHAGQLIGVVLVFHDVSEQRRLAREMTHQATHDALTGLLNRAEFEQRLKRVVASAHLDGVPHALCYLDLDQFKVVNDTCGHLAGDELLRQITEVFRAHVRGRDTLARLGGDEFGLLLEHCPLENAECIATALRDALNEFRFAWADKRFAVGVSIGVAAITADTSDAAAVLRAADSACYVAKDSGRNRVHVYTLHDADLARRHGEMQWVSRIQFALEHDRFELYAQPIAPIGDLDAHGIHFEVLLRLQDGGQVVEPGAFLPAAERYNLAARVDRWVIDSLFAWLAAHPEFLRQVQLCTINLSGQSLSDRVFQAHLVRQLETYALPPEKICFEITETAAIANLVDATRFIHSLRAQGCRFALDDFGSGLSSFAYLKNLPVDFLKIDGAFVKAIVDDPVDLAMVGAIHNIGVLMGKQTIAEHVENDAILDRLRGIGLNFAQGYGIAAPHRIEQLLTHAAAHTRMAS